MRQTVRAVYVVPAADRDDLQDTLESILAFAEQPSAVVVVDDRENKKPVALPHSPTAVHFLPAPGLPVGWGGGLYIKVGAGLRYAIEHFDAPMIIRMDADALSTGRGIEQLAAHEFDTHPQLGILGAYRFGPLGRPRDFGPARIGIERELTFAERLRYRRRTRVIKNLLHAANVNGYEMGEHALGGCYIIRTSLITQWNDLGWLQLLPLKDSQICEDHIFGMICRACNYDIADFSGPGQPMAITWRGLAISPAELLQQHRLIVHSVRFWEDMDELTIREHFRQDRRVGLEAR